MISGVRNVMTRLAGTPAIQPLVGWMEGMHRRTNSLRVLTYHRIGYPEPSNSDRALFSATPAGFERHLEMLRAEYHVVSLDQVLEALDGRQQLPTRAVLITFDDAYCDFAEFAWPALRARNFPAILFVPTAFPDTSMHFWWDRISHGVRTSHSRSLKGAWGHLPLTNVASREEAIRRLKQYLKSLPHSVALEQVDDICQQLEAQEPVDSTVLGWNELRRLAGDGLAVGLHTRHHPLLTRVSDADLYGEITEAWQKLRRNLPDARPVFAYPGGAFTDAARTMLHAMGMQLAFTTRSGTNEIGVDDPLRLRRIHIGMTTCCNVLRAKLVASHLVASPKRETHRVPGRVVLADE